LNTANQRLVNYPGQHQVIELSKMYHQLLISFAKCTVDDIGIFMIFLKQDMLFEIHFAVTIPFKNSFFTAPENCKD
jgi:hypothetical protein